MLKGGQPDAFPLRESRLSSVAYGFTKQWHLRHPQQRRASCLAWARSVRMAFQMDRYRGLPATGLATRGDDERGDFHHGTFRDEP